MMKNQTFLYEAYLDVDATIKPASLDLNQEAGEGVALRQDTFGGEVVDPSR